MSGYHWQQQGQPGFGRLRSSAEPRSRSLSERLNPTEVKRQLDRAGGKIVLLDIRSAHEWHYDGRIAGATWIPMDELAARMSDELPTDAEIVVVCAHGVRSAAIARYLRRVGYEHVSDMAGGLLAWEEAGLPLIGKH